MSDSDISNVKLLLDQFRSAVLSKNSSSSNATLTKLKIALTKFNLYPPFNPNDASLKSKLTLARDVYELAALDAVHHEDLASFKRQIAQLRPYYYDYAPLLTPSSKQSSLVGLHLLSLLAADDLAGFHSELELLMFEDSKHHIANQSVNQSIIDSPPVRYVIELEQLLTEGCYQKVLTTQSKSPVPEYAFFISQLVDTVRQRIAENSEMAYERYPINQAIKLFLFDNQNQLESFIEQRGWKTDGRDIVFAKQASEHATIDGLRTIGQQLQYAKEMERIV